MAAVTLPFLVVGNGVAVGVTTGNSVLMSPGLTVGPGSTEGNGGTFTVEEDDEGLGDAFTAPTTAVTEALAGESPGPWTVTLSVTCSPKVAAVPSLLVTSASTACSPDRSPIEHVWSCPAGHNVNVGGSAALPWTDAVAVTELSVAVLQIQIEYVILPPGHTLDSPRTICAVTQMTPGVCDGLGLGELDAE